MRFSFLLGDLGKSQTEESHDQHTVFLHIRAMKTQLRPSLLLCHPLLPFFLLLYLFHMQTELCILSPPSCLIFLSAHYKDFIPYNKPSTTVFQTHYHCFLKCPTKTFPQWIVLNLILSVGLNLTYLVTLNNNNAK